MRPVERGEAPRPYSHYRDALDDLEERLGRYCCYCERRLPISLAVEHVSPKSIDDDRETDWDNFLLSCTNCNSVKGNTPTNGDDFVWPDKDNTLLAVRYMKGGIVEANNSLPQAIQRKAENLIDLVGLDRYPGHPDGKLPARRDKRYLDREEIWSMAIHQREILAKNDNDDFRATLITVARGWGYFGIWMTVFRNDVDIKKRLIDAFQGTARDCFDEDFRCVPREGGHT